MSLESLRKRLASIERARGGSQARKVLRIITEDDADRARQLAGIDIASLFLIERRLIAPNPRRLHA